MLLAVSNGRGGGDSNVTVGKEKVAGRWGGDRIAVIGDYAEEATFLPVSTPRRFTRRAVRVRWYKDVSELVRAELEAEFGLIYVGSGWLDRYQLDDDRGCAFLAPDRQRPRRDHRSRGEGQDYKILDLVKALTPSSKPPGSTGMVRSTSTRSRNWREAGPPPRCAGTQCRVPTTQRRDLK